MSEELLEQLEEWHEEDEYEEIVDAIMEIPAEERDYVLISHLGRAMSNLERYEEAVEQFLLIAEEGKDDPLWHYRIGLAYYYLEQYEDARRAFEVADHLEPGDDDTLEFLEWIRNKTAPKPVVESAVMAYTDPDVLSFWNDSAPAAEKYVSAPPTDDVIESVEEALVFKLPASYVNMMKLHNGGIPHNRYFPLGEATAEGKDAIEISGILGIGREKKKSLAGSLGSRFMIETGGYPEVGVVICDCPSESEVVMLDYRPSGNDGEPEVIHVDKGQDYKITRLAVNFEAFINGLVSKG
ncbi:SMI1/KNR4 family protein [Paenibacillus sp. Cedars]|uniref:SMI1/KNR4 family protein n=1 Tax=Paenibacillus sp. Cedars TaxID=1980674 RepID=UPI0011624ED4|nr:SMI1/KNR4 family protein [Paenibacillus sp. Cedars]AWP30424.1 cell wall assembly protein [Paenibacillus sp. Cedars]